MTKGLGPRDSVAANGIITPLIAGLTSPDGIAVDTDGSRLFVAHVPGGGRIDQVSLPGAMLTQGQQIALDGGYYTTGIIVDGDDNVIYKTSNNGAVIDAFNAP